MNSLPSGPGSNVKDLETAKLLLEEWKFRQQHCWSILPRYGLAAALVSLAPYLRMELLRERIIDLRLFPIIGWILALAAIWLFLAEQYRAHAVLEQYRNELGKERIHPTDKPLTRTLDRLKVRWTTAVIYLIIFTVLSAFNYTNLSRFR